MSRTSLRPVIRITPNVVDCLYMGALPNGNTCFGGIKNGNLAHVECWRAHFGLEPFIQPYDKLTPRQLDLLNKIHKIVRERDIGVTL